MLLILSLLCVTAAVTASAYPSQFTLVFTGQCSGNSTCTQGVAPSGASFVEISDSSVAYKFSGVPSKAHSAIWTSDFHVSPDGKSFTEAGNVTFGSPANMLHFSGGGAGAYSADGKLLAAGYVGSVFQGTGIFSTVKSGFLVYSARDIIQASGSYSYVTHVSFSLLDQ